LTLERVVRETAPVRALILLPLVLVGAGVSSGAAAVPSGPPGQWTRISETNGSNTDIVGLARTGDGVLHVAWEAHEPNNRGGLRHTAVATNGRVTGTHTIVTNWGGVNRPDLIRTADGGLRIFFGGLRNAFVGDPNNSLNTATAPASGVSWTLQPGSVTRTSTVYAAAVGAALARDGTPVVAWDGLRTTAAYHVGVDPSGPEFRYVESLSSETCGCPVLPDIVADAANGQLVIAWHSLISGLRGTVAQLIGTSGPGPAQQAPGSEVFDGQRPGLTARIGGPGVYLAYTVANPVTHVRLWRVGAAGPVFSIPAAGARFAFAAAAPEGRIWLGWYRRLPSGERLFFTRTNEDATRRGDVVSVAPPPGTTQVWRLAGDGSNGPLDVLAHVSTADAVATWHTQVLPALHAEATGLKNAIRVKVTEARDPVPGVRVRVGTKSATTNVQGVATIRNVKPGPAVVTVSKAGYRRDTDRARVRGRRRR
jgi:hypothetical protein